MSKAATKRNMPRLALSGALAEKVAAATYEELPVTSLFVDAVTAKIVATSPDFTTMLEIVHKSSPGYQRNPREPSRIKWWKRPYNPALARPLEVSARDDGTYAVVDGGGSWMKKLMEGIPHAMCRVHRNLTRAEEAILFDAFDKQRVRLTTPETFLAGVAAGDETALAIVGALSPNYSIARHCSPNTINSVLAVKAVYRAGGVPLLCKTAQIAGNTWGSGRRSGYSGHHVNGNAFVSLALIVEARPDNFDEKKFRRILEDCNPDQLANAARQKAPMTPKTKQLAVLMAAELARRYNNRLSPPHTKITSEMIASTKTIKAYGAD